MVESRTSTRLMTTLFVSQSFFSASNIGVFTLLAIVGVQLSGSEALAGMPSFVMTVSQAFAAYPIGLIMGRFGRRIGLSVAYAAGVLSAVIGITAIMTHTFPLLLVSTALMGTARAGADQSRFAAAELYSEQVRARMIGRIVSAGTIGAILGPLLVGPSTRFVPQLGLDANSGPWVVALCLYGAAVLLTFLTLRPDPMAVSRLIEGEKPKRNPGDAEEAGRSLRELLTIPSVQLAISAMLISQTVMVVLMVMTPLYMHQHNYGSDSVSLVISAHTLGMFGLAEVTGYLIDRFGRNVVLAGGALILIASAIIAPMSTELPILVVSLFLLGLGWNFGYVAGSSLLADTLQGPERVRVQGTNDTVIAFAAGFGNLGAGVLFSSGGYLAVSMLGVALTVVLMLLIGRLTPLASAKAAV